MSTTAIIDAVLYCISNGADVVNMSLGMPAPPGLSDTKQSTLDSVLHTVFYGYIIKPIDKSVLGIQIELAYGKYTSEHELRYNKERYNSLVNDSLDTIIIINIYISNMLSP